MLAMHIQCTATGVTVGHYGVIWVNQLWPMKVKIPCKNKQILLMEPLDSNLAFSESCSPLDQEAHSSTSTVSMSMQVQHVSLHGPFRIRTLAREMCTIIVRAPHCTHTSLPDIHFCCKFVVCNNMLPTRVRSTFSISSTFHVDSNARCSCLGRFMGRSVRALMAT